MAWPGLCHKLASLGFHGAGASFPGLTVDQFQRRTNVVEYTRASLKKALLAVKKFAELEGLGAHGKSADVRVK